MVASNFQMRSKAAPIATMPKITPMIISKYPSSRGQPKITSIKKIISSSLNVSAYCQYENGIFCRHAITQFKLGITQYSQAHEHKNHVLDLIIIIVHKASLSIYHQQGKTV